MVYTPNLGAKMKDFFDGRKVLISQYRATDKYYDFVALPETSGSAFIWSNYVVTSEGRLASTSPKVNFVFPITTNIIDSQTIGRITFPSTLITEQIREDKIFWRVNATNISTGLVHVLVYGEIWLESI